MSKRYSPLSPAARRLAVYAALRIDARRASGVISEEILSNAIDQYLQDVALKNGVVEPGFSLPPPSPRAGAPLGNTNRLTHGRDRGEVVHLRAQVRAFVRDARAAAGSARHLLARKEKN